MWKSEKWRHADEEKLNREKAVDELIGMLKDLMKRAKKEGYNLAPFIGIACPGKIEEDGSIAKGAQNLPGNWESSRFNLPAGLAEAIPSIDDHDTTILMHNDAVVQGLSEVPFMQDVKHWGVLTIGTGLGNARFTNRAAGKEGERQVGSRLFPPPRSTMTAPAPRGSQIPACPHGEVAEWLNAPHSKCGIRATVSGVRIPPSPPWVMAK